MRQGQGLVPGRPQGPQDGVGFYFRCEDLSLESSFRRGRGPDVRAST